MIYSSEKSHPIFLKKLRQRTSLTVSSSRERNIAKLTKVIPIMNNDEQKTVEKEQFTK